MNKPRRSGFEIDGAPSQTVDSKGTAKDLILKLAPYLIGGLLLAGLIAAHLLLGLRPQH